MLLNRITITFLAPSDASEDDLDDTEEAIENFADQVERLAVDLQALPGVHRAHVEVE